MPPRMPFSMNMCMSMSVKSSRLMLVYLSRVGSEGVQVCKHSCKFCGTFETHLPAGLHLF